MTSKSAEWNSNKKGKKKSGSPKPTVVAADKKVQIISVSPSTSATTNPPPVVRKTKTKKSVKSVGLYDQVKEKQKKKKTKSLARKFISLSIVAYLGYSTLYTCDSPFDQTTEKPLICSAIDPIKLDIYSLFQSNYYKQNIDPYVSPVITKATEVYHEYGLPVQHQVVDIYWKHGKPNLDRAYVQVNNVILHHGVPLYQNKVLPIYNQKVLPLYNKKVAPVINPYIKQAQPYLNQVKPMYENGVKTMYIQANEAQSLVKSKWNDLPPAAQHVKQQVLDWIDRAENTDMVPILIKAYWNMIDLYQYGIIPVINHSQAVKTVKFYYNENAKEYVNQHVKPFVHQINQQIHLDQFIAHIISLLPERPVEKKEQVFAAKTSSTQVKTATSTTVPKTQHVPITPPAASVKTVTVSQKTIQDTPAPASTTSIESTVVEPTHVSSQEAPKPKATIAKSVINDIKDHIIKKVESSIKPSSTPKPDPEAAPDANKKEAIYCPTCNAEEEQLIVANTDKHVIPARSDKHVIPVPTDNEVFELHKQDIDIPVQPTTPSEIDDDEQIVILAPIPSNKKEEDAVKEEDVVFSIQTEVPTESIKEEDIVFSIQTEVPTQSFKKEDIVFSIQTETPSPSFTEEEDIVFSIQTEEPAFSIQTEDEPVFSIQTEAPLIKVQKTEPIEENETIILNVEDNLEQEKVQDIDRKIVEEIRHEAEKQEIKKDQIFVPPAIEKEELVLDTKKDDDEPVFIKVDEPQVEHVDHFEDPIVKVVEQEDSTEEPIVVVQAAAEDQQKPFDAKVIDEPAVKIKAPFKEPVEQ